MAKRVKFFGLDWLVCWRYIRRYSRYRARGGKSVKQAAFELRSGQCFPAGYSRKQDETINFGQSFALSARVVFIFGTGVTGGGCLLRKCPLLIGAVSVLEFK